jgi:DNA-binding beta-propeller fold protein YncE
MKRSILLIAMMSISLILVMPLFQTKVLANADPVTGDYVVTEYGGNTLSLVTPGGSYSVIYSFAGGTAPGGVAFDYAGNYIVAETAGDKLSKVTPGGSYSVIYSFTSGTAPSGVAIDYAGNYIVTEYWPDMLSKITPGGVRTVIYTFAAGTQPGGVAIDSAGNYIVAEFNRDILSKITPGGVRTVIYTFAAGTRPTSVAIDYAGNYIVTERKADKLSKVTPSGSYSVIHSFTDATHPEPYGIAIAPGLFPWNFVFEDDFGRGTILKINTMNGFFDFIAPGKDYGVRKATCMQSWNNHQVIMINHRDSQLILSTVAMGKIDYCWAMARDLQTHKCYFLYDPPGIEK